MRLIRVGNVRSHLSLAHQLSTLEQLRRVWDFVVVFEKSRQL